MTIFVEYPNYLSKKTGWGSRRYWCCPNLSCFFWHRSFSSPYFFPCIKCTQKHHLQAVFEDVSMVKIIFLECLTQPASRPIVCVCPPPAPRGARLAHLIKLSITHFKNTQWQILQMYTNVHRAWGKTGVLSITNSLIILSVVIESRCLCVCVCVSVCLCHCETPTSGCWVDLRSKNAFLVLACDEPIQKK